MRKKLILFIITFCFLCVCKSNIAYAESQRNYDKANNDVTITSQVGIQGMYKYDRSIPVEVVVTNSGETFVGKVQIIEVIDLKDTITYEYDIEVLQNSDITINETILFKTNLALKIQVIDENGNIMAKEFVEMKDDNSLSGVLSIGVISRNPKVYSVFEQEAISYFGDLDSKVLELDNMLPFDNYQQLEMLDIIIINNYDTTNLDANTIQVLKEWVFDGGILLVGTGRYINSTLPMFENWLDINVSGNSSYSSFFIDYDGDTPNNIPIYEIEVSGAEQGYAYADVETIGIVQTKYLGSGRVVLLEFNIEETDILQVLGYSSLNLGEFLNVTVGYEIINELTNEYYNRFNDLWSISNILSSIIFENLPNIKVYTIMILFYFIIIGPVVYYFYKKKKNFYFSIIIVSSIIFTMLIYLIGKSSRFDDAFINYASIIKVDNKTEIETTFFSIRNSVSKPFSFGINDEYNIEPQFIDSGDDADLTGYEKASITKRKITESYIIDINKTKAFDEKKFKVVKSTQKDEDNFFDIEYYNGSVSGIIHNPLDTKLESAMIILDNNMIYIGDIEPQASIDVTQYELIPIATNSFDGIIEYMENNSNLKKVVLEQRRSVFEYFADHNKNDFWKNPQLIAFTSKEQDFTAQNVSNYDTRGITLYSINLNVDTKQDNTEYIYDIMRYMNCYNGSVDSESNIAYSQSAELEVNMQDRCNISNIHVNYNVCDYGEESKRFDGHLYIYNYYTEEYELIEEENISVSKDCEYVEEGIFKIKIEASSETSIYQGYAYPKISVVVEVE